MVSIEQPAFDSIFSHWFRKHRWFMCVAVRFVGKVCCIKKLSVSRWRANHACEACGGPESSTWSGGFFEFLNDFLSCTPSKAIQNRWFCKFQARIRWDTLNFIFLGGVGMQTCLKIDFDWPLHDPHTLYSTIYQFTLVLPTFWQDGLESADSFDLPFAMEEVAVATTLKCRSISEMLMERCILEEVEDSDRILAGAKQLLLKYAQGSYLCMEILLKLAAVAVVTIVSLVQTVQDESAVKLCVGVTLATAATIGLAQPYLQPQLNSLQVVCFTSLSISGLGFARGQVWLSQIALFLPFIVAGWQLMTPDSSQSLAVRLWNETKQQIPKMQKGEEIEVMAETFTFRWWDPKRSRHPTFCC